MWQKVEIIENGRNIDANIAQTMFGAVQLIRYELLTSFWLNVIHPKMLWVIRFESPDLPSTVYHFIIRRRTQNIPS